MKTKFWTIRLMLALTLVLLLALNGTAWAEPSGTRTYTLDADFDEGTLVNLNHNDVADQLQLDSQATPFEFIWVAASGRGTIVKIDTVTGDVLGEYWSAPQPMAKNPSRTTVDGNGNVWAGNRDESGGGHGSAVHIGLQENGQCVDRNGNGIIDTSTGLGDIKAWTNTGGADTNGGVLTAEDECIIHFIRTAGTNVRTFAIDASNNIWIGGMNTVHQLYDSSGVPIGLPINLGCGGYGGIIDANGVLWSASLFDYLGRIDPSTPSYACIGIGRTSYGLGIDSSGNIWNSNFGYNTVTKIAPSGAILGIFNTSGYSGDRGVTVTPDDDVWVANSGGNNVSRLNNDGTFAALVTVGSMPTGMAVDAQGKVWVTNYSSHNVMRIDPATNLVDLTVSLGSGAYPYNYSDMTGSTLIAPPGTGTWTVVYDSGMVGAPWSLVSWNSSEPEDSQLTVKVASSTDGITFGPEVSVANGAVPAVADGQYLKVIVSFQRATTGESPVLYDLTVSTNQPPVADANGPYVFPLNAGPFDGNGSSDPDGDALTFDWDWGDESSSSNAGATPSHTYAEAGIYDVCLTVNDGYVDSDEVCTMAVIYDPDAGFVTGGGWIDSPEGALRLPTDLPFYGGHYYQRFAGPVTWDAANEAANASGLEGCAYAHLATITSQEEQDAILAAFGNDIVFAWLGGYQPEGAQEPNGGWQWVTGEPWDYTNWQDGEPNDVNGEENGEENALHVGGGGGGDPWISDGKWNDMANSTLRPYIVEYEQCGPIGKATFGFVSKYLKGASVPTGNTEFQFHAASLNFHSTSYEWLVVTGGDYAKFKGEGTINGEGAYKFMIWAGDGDPDTFRIKIWVEDEFGVETVIYDNGMDQAISSGNIVVHTKK